MAHPSLLISGLVQGGGLFALRRGRPVRLDRIPSSGIVSTPWGIYRLRFSRSEGLMDRLVDDVVVDTWTVDGASQLHGLILDGDNLAAVDTTTNRVLWLDPHTGALVDKWQASKVPDSWHLNSLTHDPDGRLVVGSFGRWPKTRAWYGRGADRRGELVVVGTGQRVLGGLAAPHSPVSLPDGSWLLTEAFTAALVRYSPTGTLLASITLGGWPRGIAVVDGVAWVGVGDSHRKPMSPPGPHSVTPGKVVAVDLDSMSLVDEVSMPCSGIYDVVVG